MNIQELFEKAIAQTYPEGEDDINFRFDAANCSIKWTQEPDHSKRIFACDPWMIKALDFTGDCLKVCLTTDSASSPVDGTEWHEVPYPLVVSWRARGAFNLRVCRA